MSKQPDDVNLMSDDDLDRLLGLASPPPVGLGAKQRLMQKVQATAIRPPEQARSRLGWLAGIPLAASLALGIYLGNAGTDSSLLPQFASDILADTALDETLSGIEDVVAYSEDSTS